ncbi:DUF6504 family protein [Nocardioides sp.]|uniref:DUF6504 family protein n=1 Tax=Nocardioides sp. TaxID=35761 RepID=UPI003527326C
MRRYDDPVEVRQGWIGAPESGVEGPEQFLWRGRLWQVRAVVAHWVETGPWWRSAGVRAVLGTHEPEGSAARSGGRPAGSADRAQSSLDLLGDRDLLVERELWRVEAGRGRPGGSGGGATGDPEGWSGVFDLSFSWADGCWQLVGCLD